MTVDGSPALRFDGASVGYGGLPVVSDVSFTVPTGQVTVLVGPNGSGKSTLLRTVYGAGDLLAGTVLLDERDIRRFSPAQRAERIGVVVQDDTPPDGLTGEELVGLGRYARLRTFDRFGAGDRAAVSRAMDEAGCRDLAHTRIRELSGGQRQQLLFARALVNDPGILLLDELTNHLDIRRQLSMLTAVAASGRTVLAVLHDLDLASAVADTVHVLADGHLVASGPPKSALDDRVLAEVFGVRARRFPALHSTGNRLILDLVEWPGNAPQLSRQRYPTMEEERP